MKKSLSLFALASLLAAAYLGGSARAQAPAPVPADKTAGEFYKNVQVLKDIPASDLTNTMWFIAGSLGVPCQHCHAAANESDAKEFKLTARKMIQMTRDLNTANFGGKPVVTCNTCHQGSLRPNGVPNYWGKDNKTPEQIAAYLKERQPVPPQAQPTAATPPASPAETLPRAETVYENYRKAMGAAQVTSVHMIATADPDLGPPINVEIYAIMPDKLEQILSTQGNKARQLINGDRGWSITPAGSVELPPDQVKVMKSSNPAFAPFRITTPDSPRTVTRIEKIGDHSYYVLESHTAKNRSRLYFDTQSGLLYKTHGDAFTPLGTYPYETVYSDYRDVDGVMLPGALANFGTSGGIRFKFSLIEINVPVDPKKFDLPSAPPAASPK